MPMMPCICARPAWGQHWPCIHLGSGHHSGIPGRPTVQGSCFLAQSRSIEALGVFHWRSRRLTAHTARPVCTARMARPAVTVPRLAARSAIGPASSAHDCERAAMAQKRRARCASTRQKLGGRPVPLAPYPSCLSIDELKLAARLADWGTCLLAISVVFQWGTSWDIADKRNIINTSWHGI